MIQGQVIRQIKRLEEGDCYGEHSLFLPHELYKNKPKPNIVENNGDNGFNYDEDLKEQEENQYNGNDDNVTHIHDDDEGNHSHYNKLSIQIGVPSTSDQPCEYWRLPRQLLHVLRAKWSLEEENFKLNVLK